PRSRKQLDKLEAGVSLYPSYLGASLPRSGGDAEERSDEVEGAAGCTVVLPASTTLAATCQ
ncbi:MAG: hypothetical protein QGM47_10950, partial [Actinomycetota bacterium]|nr:hypothetical protein [Actinomycetota bacterium]